MDYRKLGAGALAAALLTGAAGASLAQPPAPASAEARGPMRERLSPEQRLERRAERLRAVLQLRPEQEPALRAYLSALRPPAGARERMRGERQAMAELTTPERLDRRRARMEERQRRFEVRAEATKRFYAQLNPAQQKAFDALGQHRRGKDGHGFRHRRG